jgi:hypothetical protein
MTLRTITALLIPLAVAAGLPSQDPAAGSRPSAAESRPESKPSFLVLKDTRSSMSKWIETQQIISRERKDWQQGREILLGRIELVKQEVSNLEDKIKQAESQVAEADAKKKALVDENDKLKATGARLAEAVGGLEAEVRRLFKRLPDPLKTKIQPLYQRIPEDPANTKVAVAERYQNVVGVLNELNKANNEIVVNYEVHTLADGKPSEVKAIYVGLAQAYYVSARGEAGIGRPTDDGWKWEPSKAIAADVLMALDILQGKHSPAFVPLPVKIQ